MFDDVWWYLYKCEETEGYKRTAYLFNIHISPIQSIIKIVFEPDCFWHILFLERPILSLTPSRQQPLNVWGFDQFLIEIILLTLNFNYPSKDENEEERAGYKTMKTVIEKYSHLIKSGSKKVKSMKKSVSNPPLLSIFFMQWHINSKRS